MQYRLAEFDKIDSTNLGVKRAIDGGQTEGLVVRAASQTGGYGRQGRFWASPEGGLYFSVLLRPSVRLSALSSLSLAAALAVLRAIRSLLPEGSADRLRIKWPNDIIVASASQPSGEDKLCAMPSSPVAPLMPPPGLAAVPRIKKLCGISLEAHRAAVCLGVGVNVVRPDRAYEFDGKNEPVYLADLGFEGSIDEVFEAVLDEFDRIYAVWQQEGFAAFTEEFEAHLAYRDLAVEVRDIAGKVHDSGILRGVDDGGRLLIEQKGAMSCVSSGELCLQ